MSSRRYTSKQPLRLAVCVGLAFAALALPAALRADDKPTTACLEIEMDGFRNARGSAAVLLYDSPRGFPTDPARASRKFLRPIRRGRASARLDDLKPGRYAVSVLHDEDGDQKMRTNWLGIPREGVGVSCNPDLGFGAPKYKEAALDLTTGTLKIQIEIRYIF